LPSLPSPHHLPPPHLPSSPTPRSSDLRVSPRAGRPCHSFKLTLYPRAQLFFRSMHVLIARLSSMGDLVQTLPALTDAARAVPGIDRKSTRLNSSHEWISYAGFCLKKKN